MFPIAEIVEYVATKATFRITELNHLSKLAPLQIPTSLNIGMIYAQRGQRFRIRAEIPRRGRPADAGVGDRRRRIA